MPRDSTQHQCYASVEFFSHRVFSTWVTNASFVGVSVIGYMIFRVYRINLRVNPVYGLEGGSIGLLISFVLRMTPLLVLCM